MRAMAMLISLAVVGTSIILLGLYNGFCFAQGGFPDQETSYRRAITDVIARYPPAIEMERRNLDGGRSVVRLGVPERVVRYLSVEEFRQLNPDCCAVVKRGREGYEPSPISRLLGYESRIVRVRYLVRYRSPDGGLIAKPTETYVVLSRCGQVFSP